MEVWRVTRSGEVRTRVKLDGRVKVRSHVLKWDRELIKLNDLINSWDGKNNGID